MFAIVICLVLCVLLVEGMSVVVNVMWNTLQPTYYISNLPFTQFIHAYDKKVT